MVCVKCIQEKNKAEKRAQCSAAQINTSSKSALLAFFLCLFLGFWGAHRFYAGKKYTAALQILLFGGYFLWDWFGFALGVWVIADACILLFNKFKDSDGKTLRNPLFEIVEFL